MGANIEVDATARPIAATNTNQIPEFTIRFYMPGTKGQTTRSTLPLEKLTNKQINVVSHAVRDEIAARRNGSATK